MTLSELKGLATVGNGQRFSEERERAKELLVDAVLTYVADIEEAERGATPRQRDLLDFFERYRSEHKRYPTIRQAAAGLGVNHVTVFEHAEELVRKGLMRKKPNVSRGLELVR